jgi:hypothetical protein
MRTSGGVVGDRKRASDAAGGAGCEVYVDGATRSPCEARKNNRICGHVGTPIAIDSPLAIAFDARSSRRLP